MTLLSTLFQVCHLYPAVPANQHPRVHVVGAGRQVVPQQEEAEEGVNAPPLVIIYYAVSLKQALVHGTLVELRLSNL